MSRLMPAHRCTRPVRVADRHTLREDGVVLAVDTQHAVLAIPHVPRAHAFLPRGYRASTSSGCSTLTQPNSVASPSVMPTSRKSESLA